MIITELPFDACTIPGPADVYNAPRSGGLHLSQIYSDLEETYGVKRNNLTEKELAVYRSMGFIWEWVVEAAMERTLLAADNGIVRPGEFHLDGIAGSPDLIELSSETVIDTKATWRSADKLDNLEKYFWTWLVQAKGYCKMVGVLKFRWIVFCVCGNWAPPVPCVRQLDARFTQREVDDNWSMVTRHAREKGWR